MHTQTLASLSDRELLVETQRAAEAERNTTVALVSLLAEVDARRLYLGEGYSSMFTFCTRALRLSESAAYARITAARTARRLPRVLALLKEGAISLTTISLLAPHLGEENHEAILDAARGKSKRDVERLVAGLQAQPDIQTSIRALPVCSAPTAAASSPELPMLAAQTKNEVPNSFRADAPAPPAPSTRAAVVAPIAAKRYLVRITIDDKTYDKLERARALLRHQVPDGDAAAILDLALSALIEKSERTKFASTKRPNARTADGPSAPSSRHIPAAVRRTVWTRDEGQCAFVGTDGQCRETGFLEFHHVVPFAAGGPSTPDNLQLRCRAHNAHAAAEEFGDWRLRSPSGHRQRQFALASTPSGQS